MIKIIRQNKHISFSIDTLLLSAEVALEAIHPQKRMDQKIVEGLVGKLKNGWVLNE